LLTAQRKKLITKERYIIFIICLRQSGLILFFQQGVIYDENIMVYESIRCNGWNDFQVGIHAIGVVKISDHDFAGTKDGESLVGYGGGERPLRIQTGLDSDRIVRTSLHELGHALGLRHEHQRYDRDTYLMVTEGGSAYEKIPEYLSGWRWEWMRVRIGWWTISIPYLAVWKQRNGAFDFDSIMLYDGFQIKNAGGLTKYNTALSKTDIATVKLMY
jgi:hypothetical protein